MFSSEFNTPANNLQRHLENQGVRFAFTRKQREWIRDERDGGTCQFPEEHRCKGRLEVHHISPQGYLKRAGVAPEDIDNPYNAITVCQEAHHKIHPDIAVARKMGYTRDLFRKRFTLEGSIKKANGVYWNNAWDGRMRLIARDRTEELFHDGNLFPGVREKALGAD